MGSHPADTRTLLAAAHVYGILQGAVEAEDYDLADQVGWMCVCVCACVVCVCVCVCV
jgi:hypothetical protein